MKRREAHPSDGPFTPGEVATMERLTAETIRRHLRRGILRGYKVGKDWRVTVEALQEWRRSLISGDGSSEALPPFDADRERVA